MAYFDLKLDVFPTIALNSTAVSSATTTNGTTIDLQNYGACMFYFQIGATVAETFTPAIQESDDGSAWTAVADADLIGTEAAAALTTTNTSSTVGYKGKKRYARATVVSTGSSPTGTISAVAIRGKKNVALS
jgi:hypothetical protein